MSCAVKINGFITKLLKVDGQPSSIGGGFRDWADSPGNGPHDLGFSSSSPCCFRKLVGAEELRNFHPA
ncbi:hypothetical protein WKW80_33200 [Variovorax humicola]|uniref:Uncharacterized protein n=1 Tax=Variovorax humicola TaxID=1769758 RepID=A0ABU8WBQ5_9BURK